MDRWRPRRPPRSTRGVKPFPGVHPVPEQTHLKWRCALWLWPPGTAALQRSRRVASRARGSLGMYFYSRGAAGFTGGRKAGAPRILSLRLKTFPSHVTKSVSKSAPPKVMLSTQSLGVGTMGMMQFTRPA